MNAALNALADQFQSGGEPSRSGIDSNQTTSAIGTDLPVQQVGDDSIALGFDEDQLPGTRENADVAVCFRGSFRVCHEYSWLIWDVYATGTSRGMG